MRGQTVEAEAAEAIARPRTVLVAAFANISGAPADDWLSAGIAETVASDLGQFPTLAVVAHESLAGDPDEALARDVALKLGVLWMVAGGFQRLGHQLRITARIVNVETGVARETIKVDGTTDELFALQDQLVEGLGDGLAAIAETSESARVAPDQLGIALPATTEAVEEPGSLRPGGRQGGTLGPLPSAAPRPRSQGLIPPPVPRPESGVSVGGVTGDLAIGDDLSRLGVASGVGILTGRPTVRPPRTPFVPTIDGRLDDTVWANAARITEFVQRRPLDGAPATEATEVYVAYDSTNIYIGAYAHYSDPGMMRANRADRDRPVADDTFLVYLDPFLDQQRAYVFSVNAYGVQSDSILNSRSNRGAAVGGRRRYSFGPGRDGPGGVPRGDRSWDALYDSAGQVVPDGFTIEMAIPLKSLRYPQQTGDAPHQWGLQIARTIRGKDESVVWSPVSRAVAGFLTQMGLLEGMTGLSTSRNIEILPTLTALQFGSLDAGGNFATADPQPEGGVNFKYGVTSNLTADLTYNPDFSQIESDQPQIEVNQRFALFFPELRPFFLEGAEIFQFRGPVNLVHTRTIIDPRYGAKLTGKAGNTTIGVVYANDEAPGNIDDPENPALGHTAQTFVGRVRYDLYAESYVGAIFTDRELVDSYSRVGGFDSNFRLGNTHSFGVRAVWSRDRDLNGAEIPGHMFNASFLKSGRNLSYAIGWHELSPDFQTDVGFVERTDQRQLNTNISYRWWPERWLINWGPNFNYTRSQNFEGILEDQIASTGLGFEFAKNITFNANVDRVLERFGGIDFFKTRLNSSTTVSASRRIAFGLAFNRGDQIFFDEENPYLGFDTGWTWFINARPTSRLNSNINISTNRFINPWNNNRLVFNVKIFSALSTYQFTDRFLFRNISEYNSFDQKLSLNFLLTYRVNAGTVFYVGYDDRYQQADRIHRDANGDGIDDRFFQSTALKRTNRAIFTKFQYLFRY